MTKNKMRNDFAIFILTHGRPNNVITYNTLKKMNYNGKCYLVIDNEDKKADEYFEKYGKENVVVFDKLKISKEFDTIDNNEERRTVVYARNACFKIAKEKNIKYFLELDDDYNEFRIRYEKNCMLASAKIANINKLFELMIEFLIKSKAITVAFAQGGDYIGGIGSRVWKERLSRKAMNTFFCTTERPFDFIGRINEDVNTYTTRGIKGDLIFTIGNVMINQGTTQANDGGMTDVYLDSGTYVKSFFTIITSPSCTKISTMGNKFRRIHHKILWDKCTPKILNEKWKK